ncbi:MAG TPA: tail fiber domain-containing protein [Bacteroidia bacterium]|nr:tail fiber domain-containing protein [Bacteroidia bacterium]
MKKNIKIVTAMCFLAAATSNSIAQSWNLTGNAGTNGTTNFIGTTDNVNFKIRTKNIVRMTVSAAGKVGIGTTAPVYKLDIKGGSINTDSVYRIGGKTILSIKGNQNVFTGHGCGNANTTGSSNTAIGSGALYSNTEGQTNTASGTDALFTNTTGSFNTASGRAALFSNTTGDINTASGTGALYSNTEGFGNAALGSGALNENTIGNDNTATGSYSLVNNTEGSSNTANGNYALLSNITGSFNTGIGDNANTSLGTLTFATAVGAGAVVNSIDKVRLGDAAVNVVEGPVAYSWPSDGRFKENIKEDVKGLDFIMKLQPVSYNFNRLKYAKHVGQQLTTGREKTLVERSQNRTVGFIAQDVEKIIQQTGFTSFDAVHAPTNETDNYSMGYAEFVVPLVKAVQELAEKNNAQDKIIENLTSEINNLKSGLKQSAVMNPKSELLFQNSPNPFSSETEIKFQLPVYFNSALLVITDESGKQVMTYPVQSSSPVIIKAGELPAGIYSYSLIIDGTTADSKQMILTK